MLTRLDFDSNLDTARDKKYDDTQFGSESVRAEVKMQVAPSRQNITERKQPSLPPIPPCGGGGDRGKAMGSDACDLVVANLSAYQDNELDTDQEQIVEAHLQNCAYCASVYAAIKSTDRLVEREWREESPLPSSFEFADAIDSIMDALPPVPAPTPRFEPKRVHARTRWMRFATGMMGVFTFFSMLFSSYAIGFANGRRSLTLHSLSPASPTPFFLPVNALTLRATYNTSDSPLAATARPYAQSVTRQFQRQ